MSDLSVPETAAMSDLSVPETAALFLTWQQPTDRALAGWNPFGDIARSMSEDALVRWLESRLIMTRDERASWQPREPEQGEAPRTTLAEGPCS